MQKKLKIHKISHQAAAPDPNFCLHSWRCESVSLGYSSFSLSGPIVLAETLLPAVQLLGPPRSVRDRLYLVQCFY